MTIDRRKNYYLTIDTETANGLDCPIVYDLGGCVHDKQGNVMECFSFVIYESFVGLQDLMQTAYYADKIPNYQDDLEMGIRKMVRYATAKRYIAELCKKYNVKAIIAHNAYFDYKATTNTQRYLRYLDGFKTSRYFLPYGIPLWDTMRMARDTIGKQKSYIAFCQENGYMKNKKTPRVTAEILYRYMTGNNDFIESHTGLEDVMIEKEIFAWCMRQHKSMRKSVFKEKA